MFVKVYFDSSHVKYSWLVYFAKDVEDWFGYGKLNVFVV